MAHSKKKSPPKGSGGKNRRSLTGRGATPKASERTYHPAYKKKQQKNRDQKAAQAKKQALDGKTGKISRNADRQGRRVSEEIIAGRNSVTEALHSDIPAKALFVAARIEYDERVKDAIKVASERSIPIMEVHRSELDNLTDGAIHQGLGLHVPEYKYKNLHDLTEEKLTSESSPVFVALDGVTDPRNLGAIIRALAAFGADAVIIPARRSATMTAGAWKASVGAVSRIPVAQVSNLNQALQWLKHQGFTVAGLDGNGDVSLNEYSREDQPLVLVVGAEDKGLSPLVRSKCDEIISIPIASTTESLNVSMAVGIALYDIMTERS